MEDKVGITKKLFGTLLKNSFLQNSEYFCCAKAYSSLKQLRLFLLWNMLRSLELFWFCDESNFQGQFPQKNNPEQSRRVHFAFVFLTPLCHCELQRERGNLSNKKSHVWKRDQKKKSWRKPEIKRSTTKKSDNLLVFPQEPDPILRSAMVECFQLICSFLELL